MASICVFCGSRAGRAYTDLAAEPGSRAGSSSAYTHLAAELGTWLAANGHTLIFGGGSVGLMGTIADAVLKDGGRVVGVIPEALAISEVKHCAVKEMHIVPDMHARKALMHQLSDAYIALPGGFGTMEELFEVLCWRQLQFHGAPIAVVNIDGFYDQLLAFCDHTVRTEFVDTESRKFLEALHSVDDVADWITRTIGQGK